VSCRGLRIGLILCMILSGFDALCDEVQSGDEDAFVYETEVKGYRLYETDETTGFAHTILIDDQTPATSDLKEVLSNVAGVQVRSMGGLGSYGAASIRGSTPNQVPVFIDGIQLNIGGFSVVNLSNFSLEFIDRVEVYLGNAPLYLGTSGIGGALVLKTRTFESAVSEHAASLGSWNTWRLSTLYGDRFGKTEVLSIVSGEHSDGDFLYYNRNGTHNNTDDDTFERRTNNYHTAYSALLKLKREVGAMELVLMDELFYKKQGIPGSDHMVGQSNSTLSSLRNTVNLTLANRPTDRFHLKLDLGYLFMSELFQDLFGEIGIGHQDSKYQTHGIAGAGVLKTTFSKKNITTARLGVRYEHYNETRLDQHAEDQQNPCHRIRLELGAEHDWIPIPGLHIVPTLRGELHHSRFGGGPMPALPQDFEATTTTTPYISPSLGLRYEVIDGLELRANGGRYTRTPDLTELFGDHGAVVGNPELDAEIGYNADAGFTYILEHRAYLDWLRLDAAWFGSWVRDLISLEQNSQSTSTPENIDAARMQGVELSARLILFDMLTLSGNYTFFHSVNQSKKTYHRGKKLPGRPAHETYGRVELKKSIDDIDLAGWFDVDYANKSFTAQYNSEDRVAMHLFLGAGARFGLPEIGLTLFVEVKNLRDTLGFKNNNGDWLPMSDYSRYPLPGRTFLGTIRWQRP
jgi:outer membrane receptor protein involved in Fe transport